MPPVLMSGISSFLACPRKVFMAPVLTPTEQIMRASTVSQQTAHFFLLCAFFTPSNGHFCCLCKTSLYSLWHIRRPRGYSGGYRMAHLGDVVVAVRRSS